VRHNRRHESAAVREFFVALQTLVIGVSHVVQPRAWVDFFVWLRGKGHAGVFANGFLSLWFGGLIVEATSSLSPGSGSSRSAVRAGTSCWQRPGENAGQLRAGAGMPRLIAW